MPRGSRKGRRRRRSRKASIRLGSQRKHFFNGKITIKRKKTRLKRPLNAPKLQCKSHGEQRLAMHKESAVLS